MSVYSISNRLYNIAMLSKCRHVDLLHNHIMMKIYIKGQLLILHTVQVDRLRNYLPHNDQFRLSSAALDLSHIYEAMRTDSLFHLHIALPKQKM